MKEPGCEQFEVFQSVVNPDKLALLEPWTEAHVKLNTTRPPLSELRAEGRPEREDYEYAGHADMSRIEPLTHSRSATDR